MRAEFRPFTLARAGRFTLFGVWLASFALLLQTVLPLLSRPASTESVSWAFGGEAALCSAHNLAKIAAHGADEDGDRAAPRPIKCPLCQVWQSLGAALPASAPGALGPAYQPASPDTVADSPPPARHRFDSLQPRAPPLMA